MKTIIIDENYEGLEKTDYGYFKFNGDLEIAGYDIKEDTYYELVNGEFTEV